MALEDNKLRMGDTPPNTQRSGTVREELRNGDIQRPTRDNFRQPAQDTLTKNTLTREAPAPAAAKAPTALQRASTPGIPDGPIDGRGTGFFEDPRSGNGDVHTGFEDIGDPRLGGGGRFGGGGGGGGEPPVVDPGGPGTVGGPTDGGGGPGSGNPAGNPFATGAAPEGTIAEQYNAVRNQLSNNILNPQLPDSATQSATLISEGEGEIIDPNDPSFQISPQAQIAAVGFGAAEAAIGMAVTPADMAAAQAQYTEVVAAAKGTVSKLAGGGRATAANAQAAIQDLDAVDPRTMAKALTHEVPNGATVKGQLDGLLGDLGTGNIPDWAQPAIAQAEAQMAARGLSSSSVGQNAMFNAIINAAMPIAQADAKSKLAVFQQDISNEQQAMLANSTFFQNLTMKNLDNKQQASIVNATNATNANIATAQNQTNASIANAQAFLQMDIANLNNEQQALMMDSQFRQQTMLTNTAAENTALQFNAQSQQQADQFNANLATSVSQFNATQQNSARQFSANAANSMSQFNANLGFQREQFNAQNATAISQSNVNWRRQMNQMNTAAENAVNQANAMNQFNLSNQALTFLWQEQRDAAKWANDNVQNEEERRVRMAIAALSNESMADAKSLENIKTLAGAAVSIFNAWGT